MTPNKSIRSVAPVCMHIVCITMTCWGLSAMLGVLLLLQVCQLFSSLVVHAAQCQDTNRQSSSLEDEYQIMLRKYIRSFSIQTARIGIIGTASLIEQLAAAGQTADGACQQRCISSAIELFDHAMNACKATNHQQSATVFALLCHELASVCAKVMFIVF